MQQWILNIRIRRDNVCKQHIYIYMHKADYKVSFNSHIIKWFEKKKSTYADICMHADGILKVTDSIISLVALQLVLGFSAIVIKLSTRLSVCFGPIGPRFIWDN